MGTPRHAAGRVGARDARCRDFRRRQRTADLGALLPRAGSGRRRERRCRGSPAGRCRRPAATASLNGAAMILVAGGSGRLGTLIVRRLEARGLRVRVLTRDRRRAAHLEGSRVEVIEGDVRDGGSLGAAMVGVSTVVSAIHGFGDIGNVSPASVDRDGNRHLIDAAAAANAAVVLMSIVGASADASDRALSDEARWPRNTFERAARRGRSCARPPLPSSGSICSTRPQAPLAGPSYSVEASTRSILCRSPMSRHSSSERWSIPQRVARRLKSAARRMCRSTSLRQACNGRRSARRRPGMFLARCCACSPPCSDPSSRIVPVRFVRRLRWTRIDLTFAPTDLHRRFPELPVTSLADILARR